MILIHVMTTFIYEEFLVTSVMMLITMNSSFTKTEINRTGFYFLSILREKKSNASDHTGYLWSADANESGGICQLINVPTIVGFHCWCCVIVVTAVLPELRTCCFTLNNKWLSLSPPQVIESDCCAIIKQFTTKLFVLIESTLRYLI